VVTVDFSWKDDFGKEVSRLVAALRRLTGKSFKPGGR
jgi:hypothetical protein